LAEESLEWVLNWACGVCSIVAELANEATEERNEEVVSLQRKLALLEADYKEQENIVKELHNKNALMQAEINMMSCTHKGVKDFRKNTNRNISAEKIDKEVQTIIEQEEKLPLRRSYSKENMVNTFPLPKEPSTSSSHGGGKTVEELHAIIRDLKQHVWRLECDKVQAAQSISSPTSPAKHPLSVPPPPPPQISNQDQDMDGVDTHSLAFSLSAKPTPPLAAEQTRQLRELQANYDELVDEFCRVKMERVEAEREIVDILNCVENVSAARGGGGGQAWMGAVRQAVGGLRPENAERLAGFLARHNVRLK